LDRAQIPKKIFFWGLCTGIKGQKVVLFGFCTGTQGEKLNFLSSNILNSLLVPLLNPKSTTFWPLVPVQSPQKIEGKNSKKDFYGYLCPVQIPYFWTQKIF
jgi:hypothetical protein